MWQASSQLAQPLLGGGGGASTRPLARLLVTPVGHGAVWLVPLAHDREQVTREKHISSRYSPTRPPKSLARVSGCGGGASKGAGETPAHRHLQGRPQAPNPPSHKSLASGGGAWIDHGDEDPEGSASFPRANVLSVEKEGAPGEPPICKPHPAPSMLTGRPRSASSWHHCTPTAPQAGGTHCGSLDCGGITEWVGGEAGLRGAERGEGRGVPRCLER